MAMWTLKTQHKKNAVEKQFWRKDGETIIRTEGYRWGTFYCESDEQPEIDLANPDGYNLSESDYDWELDNMDDGCWAEWDWPADMTEEQQDEIMAVWEEDYFDGMEQLGWSCDDTDYILMGPLELADEDGNTVGQGEPD